MELDVYRLILLMIGGVVLGFSIGYAVGYSAIVAFRAESDVILAGLGGLVLGGAGVWIYAEMTKEAPPSYVPPFPLVETHPRVLDAAWRRSIRFIKWLKSA